MPTPRTEEWYASVREEIVDPERPIIDLSHGSAGVSHLSP